MGTSRRRRTFVSALFTGIVACSGGGDPSGPTSQPDHAPARLQIVDGNGQIQVSGTTLQLPIRVLVQDGKGRVIAAVLVNWVVTTGGGLVTYSQSLTDSLGIAANTWELGSSPGAQTAAASVPGLGPASFSATAVTTYCEKYAEAPGSRVTCGVEYSYTYSRNLGPPGTATRSMDIFAPTSGSGPFPVIVALPGGCQGKEDVEWIGPVLAARGYVAAAVTVGITQPADFGGRAECISAARAATDALASAANPYLAVSDTTRFGGVGWSMGALVLSAIQDLDLRYGAIVAWDNLSRNEYTQGDSASTPPRPPRVPAMGQSNDLLCGGGAAADGMRVPCGAEAKKWAYEAWREAGVPAMQLVFASSDHGSFSEFGAPDLHAFIAYYTVNWFDRWLRSDASATARLLADPVAPQGWPQRSRTALLDETFRSAAFLDGRNCPDLRAGCS